MHQNSTIFRVQFEFQIGFSVGRMLRVPSPGFSGAGFVHQLHIYCLSELVISIYVVGIPVNFRKLRVFMCKIRFQKGDN